MSMASLFIALEKQSKSVPPKWTAYIVPSLEVQINYPNANRIAKLTYKCYWWGPWKQFTQWYGCPCSYIQLCGELSYPALPGNMTVSIGEGTCGLTLSENWECSTCMSSVAPLWQTLGSDQLYGKLPLDI